MEIFGLGLSTLTLNLLREANVAVVKQDNFIPMEQVH
jgi:hypothetical protein